MPAESPVKLTGVIPTRLPSSMSRRMTPSIEIIAQAPDSRPLTAALVLVMLVEAKPVGVPQAKALPPDMVDER